MNISTLILGFLNIVVFIEQRGGPGAPDLGTTHQGAPGPPGAPWWVELPSEHPPGAAQAHWMSSGPKKSTKNFAAFGLHLVLIPCDVENIQKTIPSAAESRTTRSNLDTISDELHHLHLCLSDDA